MSPQNHTPKLSWNTLYREIELYKAAIRLYTKPLFQWQKALVASTDGQTFYDFARRGLGNLAAMHRDLRRQQFVFRPGQALRRNFNGKQRTLYIYPWPERLVDLLLYRLLNQACDARLSRASYAYRLRGFGVDRCQRHIQRALRQLGEPVYILKRDIADFFDSIDHAVLLEKLVDVIEPDDFLFELLKQRLHFSFLADGQPQQARQGVPFGTAVACFLANLYLDDMDHRLASIPDVVYVRYADDVLVLTSRMDSLDAARREFDAEIRRLKLAVKPSHVLDLVLGDAAISGGALQVVSRFRHLGLEYRLGGSVGLSRDKFRKISNLFRYAWRRKRGAFRRLRAPLARARLAIELCRRTIAAGIRNVAIIDYYLRHVTDEDQLRRLDRWLAEEVLSLAFGGGHKKGYFRRLSFGRLRHMGLPSLVHRRRLLAHGHVQSSFFIWKKCQAEKSRRMELTGRRHRKRLPGPPGPAVRPAVVDEPAFSQDPEAAADASS